MRTIPVRPGRHQPMPVPPAIALTLLAPERRAPPPTTAPASAADDSSEPSTEAHLRTSNETQSSAASQTPSTPAVVSQPQTQSRRSPFKALGRCIACLYDIGIAVFAFAATYVGLSVMLWTSGKDYREQCQKVCLAKPPTNARAARTSMVHKTDISTRKQWRN